MSKTKSVVSRVVGLVVFVLLELLVNWLFLPAWSFSSGGLYLFVLFSGVLLAAIMWACESIAYDDNHVCSLIALGLAGIVLLVSIIGGCASGKLFNAAKYRNLIEIQDGVFEEDVPKVNNISNVAVVDVATAQKVGDRTIAGIKNATWYEVDDEYNLIIYNGRQYRISALNYGSLFKYSKAKNVGIPGYVLVDVLTQEAQFVELKSGIKYSPSAYFNKDLRRHLRGQFPNEVFGTSFLEVNDEGNPYWITATKTATIGFWGGKIEQSFIITDACTGQSNVYTVETLPEWVDHAFDLEYLMTQVYNNFEYVNGFINFSKTGVNRTTYEYKGGEDNFEGYNSMVVNGEVMFYTGVTPASGAESNLGFILVSARTGKTMYYPCSGAEESSAKAAAEGLVQNLGYKATFPTMLNVDGVATYFMVLKDGAGLIQRYSLCNVSNYTLVVESASLNDVLAKYRTKIGQEVVVETTGKTGNVAEITEVQIEGYTYYCFKLVGDSNTIYMSTISNSSKQAFMSVGDTVTVEYTNSSEDGVYMVTSIQIK